MHPFVNVIRAFFTVRIAEVRIASAAFPSLDGVRNVESSSDFVLI